MRSAIEMARTLPASEIKDWLEHGKFNHRTGYAMTLFEKIAFERWANEEPADFLAWSISKHRNINAGLLEKIAINRPEAIRHALASLEKTEDREALLTRMAKHNPDLALTELHKLIRSSGGTYGFHSAFQELNKHRPDEIASWLGEIKGPAHLNLERIVMSSRFEKDPEGTLKELYELPNGFDHIFGHYSYNQSSRSIGEILRENVSEFPEDWRARLMKGPHKLFQGLKSVDEFSNVDWGAMGFSPDQLGNLQFHFLYQQVQSKPAEVLSGWSDYELSDSQRQQILSTTLYRTRTAEELDSLRAKLTDPDDQAYFDKILTNRQSTNKTTAETPPVTSPDQLAGAVADRSLTNLSGLMRQWTSEQKNELLETYRSLEGENKSYLASLTIGRSTQVPLELRSEALAHLLTLPNDHEHSQWRKDGDRSAIDIVSRNAYELLNKDPVEATSWVTGLPEGSIRSYAQKNLALNWSNYDPRAAQHWISTLPENEQSEINTFMKSR